MADGAPLKILLCLPPSPERSRLEQKLLLLGHSVRSCENDPANSERLQNWTELIIGPACGELSKSEIPRIEDPRKDLKQLLNLFDGLFSKALCHRELSLSEWDLDGSSWIEVDSPNHQRHLDRFQALCETLIRAHMTTRACNEFKIAVQELGQNAIEWGNAFDESKRLRLAYSLKEDRILIRITDEGEGFDPSSIPEPSDPIALIQAREKMGKRPGGFGVHLAQKVMDRIAYNEAGNAVTLEKIFNEMKP